MFHTIPLMRSVLNSQLPSVAQRKYTYVVSEFTDLARRLSSALILNPSSFRQSITRIAPRFANHRQHDAADFLEVVLASLHDGLRGSTNVPDLEQKAGPDGAVDELDGLKQAARYAFSIYYVLPLPDTVTPTSLPALLRQYSKIETLTPENLWS
jgi:hypothetical protein